MSKGKIIAGTLAGIICAGAIASGGVYGVKLLKDRDKAIDEQKTTIVALEDENKVSKEKIEQLTNDLSAKVSEIAEKDKQIAEKDNLISENNHKIQTLNSQKTTLLASVAEIDNKLTATTDAVDVDNLEARKTAILGQIDTLNIQIANLTAEKTQLQKEIETLTTEKTQLQKQVDDLQKQVDALSKSGVSFNFRYLSVPFLGNISIEALDKSLFQTLSVFDIRTLINNASAPFEIAFFDKLNVNYSDYFTSADCRVDTKSVTPDNFIFMIDGESKSKQEVLDYLESANNDSMYLQTKVLLTKMDNDNLSLAIDIVNDPLFGKYVADDGSSVEFTLQSARGLINTDWSGVQTLFNRGEIIELISDTQINVNGIIYNKVQDENIITDITNDNLKMSMVGTFDGNQKKIVFNDATDGNCLMTKATSDSDYTIESSIDFISYDARLQVLTLKNNSTGENIVLSSVIVMICDKNVVIISASWNGNSFDNAGL